VWTKAHWPRLRTVSLAINLSLKTGYGKTTRQTEVKTSIMNYNYYNYKDC